MNRLVGVCALRPNTNRAEDMNAAEVAALNACGSYISVSVYKRADGGSDGTLGGVTSMPELTLYVPHPRGNCTLEELTRDPEWRRTRCILEMLPPASPGCPVRFKPRDETR